ncbi:MAG: hypothetical protein HYX89_03815 [Chloroflexi bacterium]|nr:hypothetical protein [Chloroflexota bacterium]
MARTVEAVGIATVVVNNHVNYGKRLVLPRSLVVRFPFGRPFGEPDNSDQQRVILEDALGLLATAKEPNAVVELPYRWKREDYAAIRAARGSGVR